MTNTSELQSTHDQPAPPGATPSPQTGAASAPAERDDASAYTGSDTVQALPPVGRGAALLRQRRVRRAERLSIAIDDAVDDMRQISARMHQFLDRTKSSGASTVSIDNIEILKQRIEYWQRSLLSASVRPASNPAYRGKRTYTPSVRRSSDG